MEAITYTNSENESIELSNVEPYVLMSKEGFESVENIVNSTPLYELDGEAYISSKLSIRNLDIGGLILAENETEKTEYRNQIIRIVNPKIAGKLTYKNNVGTYDIDVIPEFAPKFDESALAGSTRTNVFQLTLKALDPYWRDKSVYDSLIPLSKVENKFKFPLILSDEFVFASLVSGEIISIENSGSVAVGGVFTLKIKGDVTNPRIYNVLTQEYFGFEGSYQNGTSFRVSTLRGNKKVEKTVDGVTTNAMSERMIGSSFLQLLKGENYLQLQADSEVNLVVGELNFTPLVLGV